MEKLIVGLGNPGDKYKNTRHNAGFQVVTFLAHKWQAANFTASSQAEALTTKVVFNGQSALLAKPLTYMNKSGEAVKALSDYFNITPENILVIHDDIDLLLGEVRISYDASAGGHNGVASVIDHLQTKAFARLRVGVDEDGKPEQMSTRDFVLQRFNQAGQDKIESLTQSIIAKGATTWIKKGREQAMNQVNG